MILIPQRLFDDPKVNIILREGNVCILKKRIQQSLYQREGYISNHVISIVLSGEQNLQNYDGNLIKVKAGEAVFIPRGMYVVSDLIAKEGVFESVLFYFDDAIIQEFLSTIRVTSFTRTAVPDHLKFEVVPQLNYFIQSLLGIYQNSHIKGKNLLNIKILELLYLFNGLIAKQELANFLFQLTLPKKRNIKSFMDQNFDKPLKIEDYAYLTGRSLSTFRRDFKSYYDTTPQKWLQERRMEKALQLLHDKEISVTHLAYEVGYENISYFIKAFKTKFGLSPKQYILSLHRNNLQH